MNFQPEALASCNLSLEKLAVEGVETTKVLQLFDIWLKEVTPPGENFIFVGFNALFDWMFVNDYFQRFLNNSTFALYQLNIQTAFFGEFERQKSDPGQHPSIPPRFPGRDCKRSPAFSFQALQMALKRGVMISCRGWPCDRPAAMNKPRHHKLCA